MINLDNNHIDVLRLYGGANGQKKCVIINGIRYMVKFPTKPKSKNIDLSYSNSIITEHIACGVANILGIYAQETMLCEMKGKVVVACKDFLDDDEVLYDFGAVKNGAGDGDSSGYGVELSEVLSTIDNQLLIGPELLRRFFWIQFAFDTLVGNFDRHNGNWGVIVNRISGERHIAPIFDCGSSLYPQIEDDVKMKVLDGGDELNMRIYTFPQSALKLDGKKINYYDFLNNVEDVECQAAIKYVASRYDEDRNRIDEFIDSIEALSEIDKSFYKFVLEKRKALLLDAVIAKWGNHGSICPSCGSKLNGSGICTNILCDYMK